MSDILNCRDTYETNEEWEEYKENKSIKRKEWERKILDKLKFTAKEGYCITLCCGAETVRLLKFTAKEGYCITQSVSKIFTVVLFEKK